MSDEAIEKGAGSLRTASASVVLGLLERLRNALPEGRPLPEATWQRRHRGILLLLWLHAAGIVGFGLIMGTTLLHSLFEGGVVAGAALLAWRGASSRKVRAGIASLGLLTSSAILVHLSGGYIEFHFHFFVMIAVMALYQDWTPFLLAVGYVVTHHGTVGVLFPASVYNHPAAFAHPWRWAAIHGAFVMAAGAASIIAWRLNEDARARSERLLTSAGQGIYGLDLQGCATFVNPAAARMLGYETEELIGRPMHVVLHHSRPDGSPCPPEACPIYAALHDGNVHHVAADVFWRRDGTSFPVEYVSTPIRERGRLAGAVVTFDDITERKRVEDVLRHSEALLAEAEAVGRIGSWEWDLVTGSVTWSDEMYRLYGYQPREFPVTFERTLERVHREDVAAIRRSVEESLAAFRPPTYQLPGIDYRIVLPGGEERILYGQGRLIAEEAGRPVRMVGAVAEITARRRAEEEVRRLNAQLEQRVRERTVELADREHELREAKGYLEHLIASNPVVIVQGDPRAARPTYVSPNFDRVLGYSVEEVMRVPFFLPRHLHPDDRAAWLAKIGRAVEERAPHVELEYRFRHKRGDYRWLYSVGRFQYDAQGGVDCRGFGLDITERKMAEESARQAQQEAERASRAKSEFLSRMSHELRTPLNAILGFAQLLEMDSPTPQARESVEQIIRGGQHLLGLINEVLDIARIDAGKLSLSLEPVRLGEVLRESLDLMASVAEDHKVRLNRWHPEGWDPHVLADRQRLKQVLLNLLSNAVKYNHPGGTVTVACGRVAANRVRISIADTGVGVAPDQMQRLFLPFERLQAGRAGVEGTGIGLAITKGLVELMGGEIGAESAPGRGSTFWVELALAAEPSKAETLPAQTSEAG
ncbi:MAG: PAS domain-containing protein [Armatimonadetes bacterium]|nr:PAS domain-containing protein [Armatimonadota bacterium]